jgi:rhodanese-related sulfurtransferase
MQNRLVVAAIALVLFPPTSPAGWMSQAHSTAPQVSSAPESKRRPALIGLDDFRRRHAAGAVLVVDVRSDESFRLGRIPGALSVPLHRIDEAVDQIRTAARKRPIVTYCACAGEHSSLAAAERLNVRGLRAFALAGGYTAWMVAGGRIER